MRFLAIFLLCATSAVNAATLEVSVTEANQLPEKFYFDLGEERQTLDLRGSERYTAAFKDARTGSEICRDAEYRTGMMMTLRNLDMTEENHYQIEIIGQLTTLGNLEKGETLACGTNEIPVLSNKAFSDTSVLEVGKTKVLIVDRQTTMLMTVKE